MADSTSERRPTVHAVIVNWNAGALLADCISSIGAVSGAAATVSQVTIVDNNSGDGSIAGLPNTDVPLKIIRNAENVGFGAACNQAGLTSDADVLLFLNPDTRLSSGSLDGPARALTDPANGSVGIVGIRLLERDGRTARNCARRPTLLSMIGQSLGLDRLGLSAFPPHFMTEWDHEDTRAVDQVMGAFFFVRTELFQRLGGFDERFFVYYEDLDFAVRAQDSGWTSLYLATSSALHHGAGTTERVKDVRLFYSWRSRILYARKHFGLAGGFVVAAVTLALEPLARTAMLLPKRSGEVPNVWRAWRFLLADMPRWHRGNTRSAVSPAR
jgi:GT2 family glycosyltransferase